MNRHLKGAALILAIYLLGDLLSRLIGGFMPGSVLGMVLFFLLLQTKVIKEDDIKGVANFVLDNMMLFFVPVTVGLMVSYKLIASSFGAVVVTLLGATLIVMVSVGHIQQFLGRKWKK